MKWRLSKLKKNEGGDESKVCEKKKKATSWKGKGEKNGEGEKLKTHVSTFTDTIPSDGHTHRSQTQPRVHVSALKGVPTATTLK